MIVALVLVFALYSRRKSYETIKIHDLGEIKGKVKVEDGSHILDLPTNWSGGIIRGNISQNRGVTFVVRLPKSAPNGLYYELDLSLIDGNQLMFVCSDKVQYQVTENSTASNLFRPTYAIRVLPSEKSKICSYRIYRAGGMWRVVGGCFSLSVQDPSPVPPPPNAI